MKRFLWILISIVSVLSACPSIIDRTAVCLNEPGVAMATVPSKFVEKLRKETDADQIYMVISDAITCIMIVKKPYYKITSVHSNIDLLPWFSNKKCASSWESFHQCMNQKRNLADEVLYRKLDREFVAKVICEEGKACKDPVFSKWRLCWETPAHIVAETDIGEGGFDSLEMAKKSLHKINALLKRVVYGPRFPESFKESEGDSIFLINETPVQEYDFKNSVMYVLKKLKETGYLKGIDTADIEVAAKLANRGRIVYFVPSGCDEKYGWRSESNSARIRFDDRECPHIQILK